MPHRGSAIGAMKGGLSGVSRGAVGQPAPPSGGLNSFGPRNTRQRGPSISSGGGYKLRLGAGGKVHPTIMWLWALVAIEVIGGEIVHRSFRHYYGS